MEGTALTTGEIIALIGSSVAFAAVLLGNLDKIISFFSKYIPKLAEKRQKKRQEEMEANLKVVIPKILEQHTASQKGDCRKEIVKEVKDGLRAEHAMQGCEISNSLDEINKRLDKVGNTLNQIDSRMDTVEEGVKDQLRQRINEIYYESMRSMTITMTRLAELNTLYKDYKRLGGNSYIDDRYHEIKENCEVIPG